MSHFGIIGSGLKRLAPVAIFLVSVGFGAPLVMAAEGSTGLFLAGEVSIAAEDRDALGEADRLVIKIYHPGSDGYEKDPKYTFRQASDLPVSFRVTPPIDMNGNARWPTFIVEVFTDNDGDVLSQNAGEFFATTGEALPLGTEGITLTLESSR